MFRIFRTSVRTLNGLTQRRVVIATAIASGSILWFSTSNRLHNDTPAFSENRLRLATTSFADLVGRDSSLRTIVWGSNRAKLLLPESPSDELRVPTAAAWLDNVALRDLAFHNEHAAFVDASGDVYQWGPKFFGSESPRPRLTLKGKNIKCIQLTETKVYALSTSGKVYALSFVSSNQQPRTATKSTWLSSLLARDESIDFVEMVPREKLSWGEQISSIVAGDDHLLAMTSKGRTFAHPVNKRANLCGQLGLSKVEVQQLRGGKPESVPVNLIPKSFVDPFKEASRIAFESPAPGERDYFSNLDDKDIHFCPLLFEIPALRGIFVDQVAAGSRSSFVRTSTGRVLAWGANEHGQLGLGNSATEETVVVPTEVILWRFMRANVRTKCVDVTAGGDLTSFVVERLEESKTPSVDLLMCGNGQWGGLGNDTYRNAQNTPVRTKNVSGLLEYNEQRKRLRPIRPYHISISPSGHVLLTLDSDGIGRDLVAWGKNLDGELGNGKKASVGVPKTMEGEDGERVMLVSKKTGAVRIEQRPAVGYGNTVIYWRIMP
ncbi:Regulator of chromosome condensation 1/beta-lactamase-inhibitor protein II [Amanita muscaria]